MSVPAAVFKAECLRLMDEVASTGQPVTITKHGKPVAQLVPVPAKPGSMFGYMKHAVTFKGDVMGADSAKWHAESGKPDPFVSGVRDEGKTPRPRTRRPGTRR